MSSPGRSYPLAYGYSPSVFRRTAEIEAETVYAIGGLYGNPFALDAIFALAAAEPVAPTLVFNGDFNWFDAAPDDFAALNARVLAHAANGDTSFSEWEYNLELEGVGAMRVVQVAVRRWKDGRVVRERFYHK